VISLVDDPAGCHVQRVARAAHETADRFFGVMAQVSRISRQLLQAPGGGDFLNNVAGQLLQIFLRIHRISLYHSCSVRVLLPPPIPTAAVIAAARAAVPPGATPGSPASRRAQTETQPAADRMKTAWSDSTCRPHGRAWHVRRARPWASPTDRKGRRASVPGKPHGPQARAIAPYVKG